MGSEMCIRDSGRDPLPYVIHGVAVCEENRLCAKRLRRRELAYQRHHGVQVQAPPVVVELGRPWGAGLGWVDPVVDGKQECAARDRKMRVGMREGTVGEVREPALRVSAVDAEASRQERRRFLFALLLPPWLEGAELADVFRPFGFVVV